MQYKELFDRSYQLLKHSSSEWEKITSSESDTKNTLNEFVLPMAGLCSLAAFLGIMFTKVSFEKALIEAIISIGKSFGGVYLSFYILQETANKFNLERNKVRFMQLVGYSYVVIFVTDFVTHLIPELFFLNFLKLYIFYVVWEGVAFCTQVAEDKRRTYVIYVSVVILLSSLIIERALYFFMPGAEIIAA
jgi:hypothetical protein